MDRLYRRGVDIRNALSSPLIKFPVQTIYKQIQQQSSPANRTIKATVRQMVKQIYLTAIPDSIKPFAFKQYKRFVSLAKKYVHKLRNVRKDYL